MLLDINHAPDVKLTICSFPQNIYSDNSLTFGQFTYFFLTSVKFPDTSRHRVYSGDQWCRVSPRKSLMRSSLSSLQVLAELLTVPLASRFTTRERSFTPPTTDAAMRSLSDRSVFWVPARELPRSLTGELSRVLWSSAWSVAGTTRSLRVRSATCAPPREPRSLPGELSCVFSSQECLCRLCPFAVANDSIEMFDFEPFGCCNFCSLEAGTATSTAALSFTGSRFCTALLTHLSFNKRTCWNSNPSNMNSSKIC